jgi:hypothetical protein
MNFDNLEKMLLKKYPLGLILRKDLTEATGGILKSKTLAVRDSEGKGIPKIYIGKYCAYKTQDVIEYLKKTIK